MNKTTRTDTRKHQDTRVFSRLLFLYPTLRTGILSDNLLRTCIFFKNNLLYFFTASVYCTK